MDDQRGDDDGGDDSVGSVIDGDDEYNGDLFAGH